MPPTNESQLVGAIAKDISKAHPGCWIFKVVGSPYQMVGVPDLLVVVEGLLFGLEVKHVKPHETPLAARRRTTAVQRSQILRINKAGGVATTIVTPQEALGVIARGLRQMKERSNV